MKCTDSDDPIRNRRRRETIVRNDLEKKGESADASTAIIPNIMEIIDRHISCRDEIIQSYERFITAVYCRRHGQTFSTASMPSFGHHNHRLSDPPLFTYLYIDGHCWLISSRKADLMLEMVFEQGNLKEQLEKERFRKSRYYHSFLFNESNNSYTLMLNTSKEAVAEILVEILTTVYDHPKGKALDSITIRPKPDHYIPVFGPCL